MIKTRISEEVLGSIKERLRGSFGDRFKGLMLYGSEARGEATDESDIDLLVLLDGRVKLANDLEKIVDAIYPVQLEIGRLIHATPAEFAAYQAGEFSLYRNVRAEGMPV